MKKSDYNIDELIGTEIGVLDDNGHEYKKITITNGVNTKNGLIVFDEQNNPYSEEDLNFSYKVTPHYLLYLALEDNGIDLPDWEPDVWNKIFNDFMEALVNSGYVEEKSK